MITQEIYDLLNLQFEGKGLEMFPQEEEGGDPFIRVPAESLVEVAKFLKEDPRLDFKMLHCISGIDYKEHLTSVIHLYSLEKKHKLVLKTDCSPENPTIPSVSNVWRAADWHERESFDLVGIVYEGHPNLRRILLSEDWEGHPLQKAYSLPDDTMFPWEGEEEEEGESPAPTAAARRATAPGSEGGELKRPDSGDKEKSSGNPPPEGSMPPKE